MFNNIQQVVQNFPHFLQSLFKYTYVLNNKSSKGSLVFVEKFEAEGADDDLLSF